MPVPPPPNRRRRLEEEEEGQQRQRGGNINDHDHAVVAREEAVSICLAAYCDLGQEIRYGYGLRGES